MIYALPYTSIIDQTDDVIKEVFSVDLGDREYTIDHGLAATYSRLGDEDDTDNEKPASRKEALFGETWQSRLTLTTFVQLFESVAGPGNIQGIKLPALQDSVIVVDEPQALTLDWWHLISRLIEILDDEYNATVIMMTATQPRIIDVCSPTLKPTPLLEDRSSYYEFLAENERVRFTIEPSLEAYLDDPVGGDSAAIPLQTATSRLVDDLLNDDTGDSVLSVGNTVNSVCDMNADVKAQLHTRGHKPLDLCSHLLNFLTAGGENEYEDNDDATAVAYLEYLAQSDIADTVDIVTASLTTRLRPADRSLIIATVEKLLNLSENTPFGDLPLLVTSTQLIEAGVDVSFATLYRDFAPLSSIVQSARRCNRSYEGRGQQGHVHL